MERFIPLYLVTCSFCIFLITFFLLCSKPLCILAQTAIKTKLFAVLFLHNSINRIVGSLQPESSYPVIGQRCVMVCTPKGLNLRVMCNWIFLHYRFQTETYFMMMNFSSYLHRGSNKSLGYLVFFSQQVFHHG